MDSSKNNRTHSLLLAVVLILFMTACMCIVPGLTAESACASPDPGWVDQTPVAGGDDLLSVTAVDAETAWTVGSYTILHTVDGGASWSPQDSSGKYVYAVDAADTMHAWAMGSLGETWPDNVLKTWDGGVTWNPVNVNTGMVPGTNIDDVTAMIWDVDVVNPDTVWGAGGGCNVVIRTTNGGWSWELAHFDMKSQLEGLMGISAVDTDTAWAVGNMGTVLRTTDGGSNWGSFKPIDEYVYYKGVSAVDADTAWVVAGGAILRTTDGGVNWDISGPGPPNSFDAICAVDAYTAWAVGSARDLPVTADSIIFKTTDGGETWVPQESGVDAPLYDIAAVDAATAWAVGDGGTILKTSDGGDSLPDIVSVEPSAAAPGGQVIVSGCDFGDVRDTAFVSFGGVQASVYTAWSNTEIMVEVPAGISGEVAVTVSTSQGASNPKDFEALAAPQVASVNPTQGLQHTFLMGISAAGTGFQPGATLRLEKDANIINAINTVLTGDSQIDGTISLFGAEPGAYDVVVKNLDGSEARLEDAFTVTSVCGAGSGTALLMLGLTLGLLSLAGSSQLRRRRKRRHK